VANCRRAGLKTIQRWRTEDRKCLVEVRENMEAERGWGQKSNQLRAPSHTEFQVTLGHGVFNWASLMLLRGSGATAGILGGDTGQLACVHSAASLTSH
jgi:hypothetical protein